MSERDSYSNLEESLDLSEYVGISQTEVRRIIADARRFRDEAAEAKRLMLQVVDDKYAAIQDGDRARVALARIVDEFGDYESLRQSREICDDRMQKLRDVRTLYREFSSETYAHDFLTNAAFHAVIGTLGQVLDGTLVSSTAPTYDALMEMAKLCPHTLWVFAHSATHPDGNVQVCGACGIARDEVPESEDNGTAAITRKAWRKRMGLVE